MARAIMLVILQFCVSLSYRKMLQSVLSIIIVELITKWTGFCLLIGIAVWSIMFCHNLFVFLVCHCYIWQFWYRNLFIHFLWRWSQKPIGLKFLCCYCKVEPCTGAIVFFYLFILLLMFSCEQLPFQVHWADRTRWSK